MKILIDAIGAGDGGISKIRRELVKGLPKTVEAIDVGRLNIRKFSPYLYLNRTLEFVFRILDIVFGFIRIYYKSKKCEAVLCLSPSLSSLGARAPLTTIVHDFAHENDSLRISPWVRFYRKTVYLLVLKKSSKLIFVSEVMLTNYQDKLLSEGKTVDSSHFCVISPSGELTSKHNEISEIAALLSNNKKIVIVPGHTDHKGVKQAIRTCASMPENFFFAILTGKRTALDIDRYKNSLILQSLNHELLSKNLLFMRWLSEEEYTWLLKNSHALLMLSEYEGFGLPVRQALFCGTPQVISNDPAMFEASCGYAKVVNPVRTDQVSEALLKVCNSKSIEYKRGNLQTWQEYSLAVVRELFTKT